MRINFNLNLDMSLFFSFQIFVYHSHCLRFSVHLLTLLLTFLISSLEKKLTKIKKEKHGNFQ